MVKLKCNKLNNSFHELLEFFSSILFREISAMCFSKIRGSFLVLVYTRGYLSSFWIEANQTMKYFKPKEFLPPGYHRIECMDGRMLVFIDNLRETLDRRIMVNSGGRVHVAERVDRGFL